MPFPIAIAGLGGIGGLIQNPLGRLGISQQRLRSPAANRRARVAQIAEAETMARAGDQFGIDLLRAWLGSGPRVRRADYRGGVEQGGMPRDGRDGAEDALERLVEDGVMTVAGRLTAAAKRGTGEKRAKAASQGTGARKGTTTRGGPRERTYVRYDPDTGERVLVTADDERYTAWSNRKPRARTASRSARTSSGVRSTTSRRKTRTQKETDAAIRRITTEATRAGLRLSAAAARGFASMAAAAGMSSAAAAALVVGTGVVAYAATRWLIDRIETVTDPAYKREQVALAYRRARLEWEKREGRKLTKLEHDFLARNFKDALKALDAGVTYNP